MQTFRGSKAGRVSIRVHFNQLALFTDDPVESTAEKAAEVAHEGHEGKDGALRADPEALAGALPADGARSGAGESPGAGGVRDAGADGRPAVRAGVGEEDGLSRGVGAGAGGVGVAPGREQERERDRGPSAGNQSAHRDIEAREIQISEIQDRKSTRLNSSHRCISY